MILVDTSVWVDHLRSTDSVLSALLEQNRVVMHPMVLGELACENLQSRPELLHLWKHLQSIQTVTHDEALYFIKHSKLMGKGIGYVDVHLLASVTLDGGTKLWTRDKHLTRIAVELTHAWTEPAD